MLCYIQQSYFFNTISTMEKVEKRIISVLYFMINNGALDTYLYSWEYNKKKKEKRKI